MKLLIEEITSSTKTRVLGLILSKSRKDGKEKVKRQQNRLHTGQTRKSEELG